MTAIASLTVQRNTGEEAQAIADELIAVYADVYSVEPYAGDPFFSVPTFINRLHAAFEMDGFEVVTGRLETGDLVGYVHGVNLDPSRPWWASLGDARPADAVEAAEKGDVFWLRELMTLPSHQNAGIGRALHDQMIQGRREAWTTLTCIWDNQPARDAYPRWGYEVIGDRIKHAEESPLYDAMILRP